MEFKIFDLGFNYHYILNSLPQTLINEFSSIIDNVKNNSTKTEYLNNALAGQIEKEILLSTPPLYENYLKSLLKIYNKETRILDNYTNNLSPYYLKKPFNLYLKEMWVNIQEKYEYNPIHKHNGAISWVYYHQIPYLLSEEDKLHSYKGNKSLNGRFAFHPSQGEIFTLPLDKNSNGALIMFPSDLYHSVFPFYSSDQPRITFAGNIYIM